VVKLELVGVKGVYKGGGLVGCYLKMVKFIYGCLFLIFTMGALPQPNDAHRVDLDNLDFVLAQDILAVVDSTGSFQWKQTEHFPWWQKLGYESEGAARAKEKIEREGDLRDHRVLESETPNFDVKFVQVVKRTYPLSSVEYLQFVLKKKAWEDQLGENIPSAYQFFKRESFTPEQIDYFSSPKFSLERHVGWDEPNIDLESEFMFDRYLLGPDRKDRIHEIPPAERLIRTMVAYSYNDDRIFRGEGIDDEVVKVQMKQFRDNLAAAYGIATAECGSGIVVSQICRGT
jgi:hypothetical protein